MHLSVSVEKDKSEPEALGSKPAGKTVVGVPALPPAPPPDQPSDAALTQQLPSLDEEELPTAHAVKAVSATDAERVLSDKPPPAAGVAGALSPRAPGAGIKTPPLAGDMFPGLPRAPTRSIETETKTRAGVAPQPGMAPKGRSTLLLDGSAPPVLPADSSSDSPPIVVPVSGSPAPKAVTQPPPWGEGAAHGTPGIPRNAAPMRPREPSIEEISASMLLPADASGAFPASATEELSGSLLVEDPPPARPPVVSKPPVPGSVRPAHPASVKPPVPHGSVSPTRPASIKPPVPKSTSSRPAAHAHRTLLGMPELPKTTPPPDIAAFVGPGAMNDQPAVILAPSVVAEMQGPPPVAAFPPAPPADFVQMPPAPAPDATAPLPPGQPPAPFTGDVEVTRLPRSGVDRALDEARRIWQLLVSKLPDNTVLRSGTRPPWFLPAVAVAGLVVGIGLVGLLVSVLRGGSHASDKDSPAASAHAAPLASSKAAPSASPKAEPSAVPATPPALGLAPCTVTGTTHVLGPSATVAAGVEVTMGGTDVAVGFAPDDHDAMAIRVDPSQLTVTTTAHAKSHDAIRRVTPFLTKGALSLVVDTDHKGDKLQGRRAVRSMPPVQLGANADDQLAWAKIGGTPAGQLWPLGGGASVDAMRGAVDGSGDPTVAIAFRSGGAVWTGTIGGTGGLAPVGPLSHVDGLGTTIGSPAVAISNSVVFVAWADRGSNDAPWKLRWTHFAAGSAPEAPTDFTPPDGGKGAPFMSPALATVPGGRVLLIWTEGPASGHVVRAQTLSLDGTRIGAPLELSPDGTNAGQAQAAITEGGSGVVAFLESSAKGFDVAATAIRCGTP
jgi:hypothetical protein